jgi:hypothetical protein
MATSATDSLSEINVKMSNYQAEYGQSGGAIINLTTKSGTKQFHGDVYSYLRNEDLNANDYFNNFNNVAKPRYRYYIGGGSIGGPVYIPGKFNRNKNKIFFFFNDQYYNQSIPAALVEDTVPTALERAGNFSQSFTVGGALIPVNPPGTKTPFPGNIVPPSQISVYGQDLLNIFPLPNFNNRAVSGGNYNYLFQETPINHSNNYTYRVDFNLTDKLRLYGRNNQIDNKSQGYAVGAAPGPAWDWSRHSTTLPSKRRQSAAPTFILRRSSTNSRLASITGTSSGGRSIRRRTLKSSVPPMDFRGWDNGTRPTTRTMSSPL